MINTQSTISQLLLDSFSVDMEIKNQEKIPQETTVIAVSNHRSFMDALILIQALDKPISIACHHYLGQMPIMRELVTKGLGCFPLAKPPQRARQFLKQGSKLLQNQQSLGIFPEGAYPMVKLTPPNQLGKFEPGFAHLAFKAPIENLAILPIAIFSCAETVSWTFPLKFFQLFDPSEELFNNLELHPVVVYEQVIVEFGNPYWVTPQHRSEYRGQNRKKLANQLSDYCYNEITQLLKISPARSRY